ncbi:MAG: insulinase family protein [Gammaproteobacteria bacterium]|nr:insulinase family protein [Gammaproteobacteria bacterium]MCP5137566.1 insulinase family protein [Gammaproteobacteria bacterium]
MSIRPQLLISLLVAPLFVPVPGLAAGAVHQYTLDNGLRLFVKEDHRAPVVVSQIWYGVGGSYEQSGMTGVSHALEHMMFKGTPTNPEGEFSRRIAEVGGDDNAFTSADYTAYHQTLEHAQLPTAFELEADRMRHLTLDPEAFRKEIQVVIEERRWRTDDKPLALALEQFNAAAWLASPARNPVIGWPSDLDRLRIDDLAAWYKAWYAPNNAIVVVAGDVDADAVHALAEKWFGPLAAEPVAVRRDTAEPEQFGMRRVDFDLPSKIAYLSMGYKVPSLKSAQDDGVDPAEVYALEVLSYLLDGNDSARLTRELVRGSEQAVSANAGYDLYDRLPTLFSFTAVPSDKSDLDQLEIAIRAQIDRLKTELVSPEELRRVKNQVVAEQVFERDALFYQAQQIGQLESIGVPYTVADDYVASVRAVTAEQVRDVARKYLIDKTLTLARIHPQIDVAEVAQ